MVSVMLVRVAQEHALSGTWSKLVRRCGSEVGIAQATKNAKRVIWWR